MGEGCSRVRRNEQICTITKKWFFFLRYTMVWVFNKTIRIIVSTTTTTHTHTMNVSGERRLRVLRFTPYAQPPFAKRYILHVFFIAPTRSGPWHYFVCFGFDPRKPKLTHYSAKVLNTFLYMDAFSSKDLVLSTSLSSLVRNILLLRV